jgi:dUTP pyrophosphatase
MTNKTKQRYFAVVSKYKDKNINLPKRQTKNAVGYDFEAAEDVVIPSIWKLAFQGISKYLLGYSEKVLPVKPTLVPTGIKAYFQEDEGLFLYNRSGNPLKRGLLLANGTGVVDSDFYVSDAEGHIQFCFWNLFPFDCKISKGQRIGQGVFTKVLFVDDDVADGKRIGGHGSTGD